MRTFFLAASLAICCGAAAASPVSWLLERDDGSPMGEITIDFATGAIQGTIPGQFGTYSMGGQARLGTTDMIAGLFVHDHLRLFDPLSGVTWFSDYGNGESELFRLNEAAIEFGTLVTELSPLGGRFAVVIREIYNYDLTITSCSQYEDLYDPDTGEWVGLGGCIYTTSTSYFNNGTDDIYMGYLSARPVTPAPVPLPAGAALLATGAAALLLAGRRRAA